MKKNLFLSLLCVTSLFVSNSASAAVTPVAGYSTNPQTSTAESPVWYTMMSSHLTASTRQNRFLKWDEANNRLCTEQYSNGIPASSLTEGHLWRLESANDGNESHVYLVNFNGKRVFVPATAVAEDGDNPNRNTPLEMNETGSIWDLKTSTSTGISTDCAEGQYVLQFVDYSGERAFLNAMDGGELNFGVTVYAAGVHQASGWFFYETEYTPAVKTVSVAANDDAFGTVAIEGQTGNSVEVPQSQAVTVTATPAEGYMFHRWVEQGTENVLSYRPTYSYTGNEDKAFVAEFVEKDYPIMTRFYVVNLTQQNRYLGAASYTVGDETHELFSYTSEAELPFTQYMELNKVQEEGAVIDKTSTPIKLTTGVESFSMKFKQYNNTITFNRNNETITCNPELVWTRQAVYIDWNNDMEFAGEGEIYESMGINSETNNFDDPNGSIENGWQRSIAIPEGTAAGTYRMRVVYMAPDPFTEDWPSKVFTDFFGELRNGVAYDFEIQIAQPSGIEAVTESAIYYDAQAQVLVAPHMSKAVVYNLAGQIVMQAENADEVSVSDLAKGVYVANIDGQMIKFIR
ncbi:GEVED domain-containing protein [Barnesiella viscericola]|uniref:T9SS type A sorting domain-containing protein n=1 Tax=Barnesiella viscericola TaxID=397865 RepID=A0A921MR17_9BACT|nr:GEVED domain-containing protein [Barnesiella viscericola]HJG88571.1 T9SS type A sorting domain-containing protein [Barnesiella viscericola]